MTRDIFRIAALAGAASIIDHLACTLMHQVDHENPRNCKVWYENQGSMEYACGRCILESAMDYCEREQARERGVTYVEFLGSVSTIEKGFSW